MEGLLSSSIHPSDGFGSIHGSELKMMDEDLLKTMKKEDVLELVKLFVNHIQEKYDKLTVEQKEEIKSLKQLKCKDASQTVTDEEATGYVSNFFKGDKIQIVTNRGATYNWCLENYLKRLIEYNIIRGEEITYLMLLFKTLEKIKGRRSTITQFVNLAKNGGKQSEPNYVIASYGRKSHVKKHKKHIKSHKKIKRRSKKNN